MDEERSGRFLRRKKGTLKSFQTRFTSYVDKYTPEMQEDLITRLELLQTNYAEYNTVMDTLLENATDTEADQIDQERADFQEHFLKIKSSARRLINQTPQFTVPQQIANQVPVGNKIKLPATKLPTFSGTVHEWPSFKDLFSKLVHENAHLSSVERFQHLKTCVTGDAAASIDTILITADNYQIAWDTLISLYENEKLLIEQNVSKLFSLTTVKSDSMSLRSHINQYQRAVRVLKTQENLTVDNLLAYFSLNKLDPSTREKWEEYSYKKKLPVYTDVIEFLTQRCHINDSTAINQGALATSSVKAGKVRAAAHVATSSASSADSSINKFKCAYCEGTHRIYACEKFLALSIQQRWDHIKAKKLCGNCFSSVHRIFQCTSQRHCGQCPKRHNTLLHSAASTQQAAETAPVVLSTTNSVTASTSNPPTTTHLTTLHSSVYKPTVTLLSTAIIDAKDKNGELVACRTLLDNGSEPNIITEELVNQLGFHYKRLNDQISGIGGQMTEIKGEIDITLQSRYCAYSATEHFIIMSKISDSVPASTVEHSELNIPKNLYLADPEYYRPRPIDLIIGSNSFYKLLCDGLIIPNEVGTMVQKTVFGWVVSGRSKERSTKGRAFHIRAPELENQLRRFWELEEVGGELNEQSSISEEHFKKTVKRNADGRFVVQLPFNSLKDKIGYSHDQAQRRLISIERNIRVKPEVGKSYRDFMHEYELLGHMQACEVNELEGYFLPHHAVFRETSSTTKCRVVFDASAKTHSGFSLNNALHVGPVVQDELFTILLRFRKHAIVITSDIKKMYRQILVDKEDQIYQKILWRSDSSRPIQCYQLKTVTYGMSCAPFLATRCLRELAIMENQVAPSAARVLQEDFYVDDCISGCETVKEASALKSELIDLLSRGGFQLHKWRSNAPELGDGQESDMRLNKSTMNMLGLSWNHVTDTLHYVHVSGINQVRKITKRSILSDVAKLFDPLGLIGPVVIIGKLLLQQLWQLELHWDETVPHELQTTWRTYRGELEQLNHLSIRRRITHLDGFVNIQLHGFCDASQAAYGAAVYVRTENTEGNVSVHLLCAKSRVAPLKTITLPRLELCGALLLVQLINHVNSAIKLDFDQCFCWTDSSIVLCWLKCTAETLKPFVANRVNQIQTLSVNCIWKHVRTNDNPADVISRGTTAKKLLCNNLWWFGPCYLKLPQARWPELHPTAPEELSEVRNARVAAFLTFDPIDIASRYSSLTRLKRVVSYCFRFINNCRNRDDRQFGPLLVSELNRALSGLIWQEQHLHFAPELLRIQQGRSVPHTSKLAALKPILGNDQLLRVGGRLRNAALPFNHQHPIILPAHNYLTKLIINYEHLRHLHAGQQAVLAAVRTTYWPISGKSTVRQILRNCVRCCRANPKPLTYVMGDLPSSRVQPNRPFSTCGLDYCGPFHLIANHRRGAKSFKAYVAVFVCFATKAAHLELVGDMTTESCLGALKRFIARRGLVTHVYSDNGTNFVGCKNELRELARLFNANETQRELANQQIQWHFIPPRTPHFGGLWEAAVKSAKHHILRVTNQASLTYEEMSTILAQVEACLNSRPLTPSSDDPLDLSALTPGHFLVGTAMTSYDEADVSDIKQNRLSHWQRTQQISQHFWKRWQRDYLSQLQLRNKWQQDQAPLKCGILVTIKEDNLPPLRWDLGRVITLHPGKDETVRVVTVKTKSGDRKISVSRLCVLPISD